MSNETSITTRALEQLVYHAVMEFAPWPMAEVEGKAHVVQAVNPSFCALLKKTADELIGKPIAQLFAEGHATHGLLDRVLLSGEAATHVESASNTKGPIYWSYTCWPVQAKDARHVGLMIQVTESNVADRQTRDVNEALLISAVQQHELTQNADRLNERLQDEILEREEAQMALRESEEFNRTITDSSPDCIKILDLEGNLLSMGDRGQKLLCIPDITPYLNTRWIDFYKSEEDRAAATAAVKKAVAGGEGNFIGFFATLHGEPKWWDVRISPIRDATGTINRLLAVSRDVTESKLADRNLAFLASISDDLLLLANIDEMMGLVGKKIGTYLGLSACAFVEIHQNGDRVVVTHDWHREAGSSYVGAYRAADFFTPEFQAAGHAGETFVVSDTAIDPRTIYSNMASLHVAALITVPVLQEGIWRFMLCAYHSKPYPWRPDEVELLRELTARIWVRLESLSAEATVREMDARLRLALDAAQLGTWNLDPARGEFSVDERYQAIFGIGVSKLTLAQGLDMIHPDDREHVSRSVEEAIGLGTDTSLETECRVIHPDGSVRWVLSKGRMVFQNAGSVPTLSGFAGTVADITERKEMELALEQTAKDLAEVDRRKSEFLATLAHELRNPLAPLRNGLELLSMADHDRATWDQAHAMMKRQLDQMVRLIDELMDLSRISRGTVDLRLERVDLRTVLDQAVEACKPLIERQDHTLVVDIPDEPVMIEGDSMRLTQVFSNLLNNSAKYTDHGGAIAVRLDLEGNEARIAVDDNGIGIAADQLSKVFDMFAQVERANDRVQGGLGIGLNIVKHLVGMHGGRIEVRSNGLGEGSSFTVRLPLSAERKKKPTVIEAAAAAKTIAPQRILIVDDNADAAAMMAMLLGKMGHELRVANNGQEALAVGAELSPDVVLMDLGMPVMDGFAACRLMRRTPWGAKALIVALSGWGQDEDRVRSTEAGFDHHLVKPASSAALLELIAAAGGNTEVK